MHRLRLWLASGVLFVVACVFVNNSVLFAAPREGRPSILAHRGIAQRFHTEGLTNDTCTASRILAPTHDYLENTIRSMQAAFERGADMVEVDVHPTTDGQFAVFHDWTVDCRTDGHGVTREHSMAALKQLDIGYGYTADNGQTFPFRGQGVGQMPTLDEVLAAFPDHQLLINVKSRDPAEGAMLAYHLGQLDADRRDRLQVYGHETPIAALRSRLPDVRTLSLESLQACVLQYAGYGWTGILPAACQRQLIFLPINVAPWLWGWPDRLLNRMEAAGSRVFVLGPYTGGGFSTGIDSDADLARLPAGYSGGIYTNELDLVLQWLRDRQ
ncbi:MAG: glycerophosphodiester phosphodiesterase family protein [Chloroflexota bacterium]